MSILTVDQRCSVSTKVIQYCRTSACWANTRDFDIISGSMYLLLIFPVPSSYICNISRAGLHVTMWSDIPKQYKSTISSQYVTLNVLNLSNVFLSLYQIGTKIVSNGKKCLRIQRFPHKIICHQNQWYMHHASLILPP